MIKPISISNQFVLKNQQIKKQQKESVEKQSYADFSGYQVGQALKAQSGIGFKQNSMPVEVTHLYNKKVEGKDHLDLPNIHVYEYPNTNLRAIVNFDKKANNLQFIATIQPNLAKYDSIKQALVNKLINEKFEQKGLSEYYDFDLYNNVQMVSSNMKSNLKKSDIENFNKILTSTEFNTDSLNLAKKELKEYFLSENYEQDTILSKLMYRDELLNDNEILKKIDNITVEDIERYYEYYLANSMMESVVTTNKQNNEQMDILLSLNCDINNKFLKKVDSPEYKLNDSLKIIYIESKNSSSSLNYFIDNKTLKEDIILKIIAKILCKYSENEKNRIEKYIENQLGKNQNVLEENKNIHKYFIRQRIFNSDFYTIAGETYTDSIKEPLGVENKKSYFGSYFKILLNNKNLDVNADVEIYKNLFEQLLQKNLLKDIDEIKNAYKLHVATVLKNNDNKSLENLELSYLGTDIFQIYETIDSITEEDIKAYINQYFLNQPPVIKINSINKDSKDFSTLSFKGAKNLYKKINLANLKNINKEKDGFSITSKPILAYMQTKKEAIGKKVLKEQSNVADNTYTDNVEESIKNLKEMGIKSNFEKYINSTNGTLNQTGKNVIKNTDKKDISHKGRGVFEDNPAIENSITNDVSDVPELSPRELELAEIDNIDVSLPSDLQEYLVAPLKKVGEGLLDNIMDLSDAALETSDKIFSTIKNFLSDAVDMF